MDKFLGVGLKGALLLWVFVVLMTVMAKVIFTKYDLPGAAVIQAV